MCATRHAALRCRALTRAVTTTRCDATCVVYDDVHTIQHALLHQVCSYRCIASYESPLLESFSLCILQVGPSTLGRVCVHKFAHTEAQLLGAGCHTAHNTRPCAHESLPGAGTHPRDGRGYVCWVVGGGAVFMEVGGKGRAWVERVLVATRALCGYMVPANHACLVCGCDSSKPCVPCVLVTCMSYHASVCTG